MASPRLDNNNNVSTSPQPVSHRQEQVESLLPEWTPNEKPRKRGGISIPIIIIAILVLMLMGAIIGASVGGTMAVKNAREQAQDTCNVQLESQKTSIPTPASASAPSDAPTSTSTQTEPSTTVDLNAYKVQAPSDIPRLYQPPCNASQKFSPFSNDSVTFQTSCNIDVAAISGDNTAMPYIPIIAYNLEACFSACERFNSFLSEEGSCFGVAFHYDMATMAASEEYGNCKILYDSSYLEWSDINNPNVVVGLMCKDSSCDDHWGSVQNPPS